MLWVQQVSPIDPKESWPPVQAMSSPFSAEGGLHRRHCVTRHNNNDAEYCQQTSKSCCECFWLRIHGLLPSVFHSSWNPLRVPERVPLARVSALPESQVCDCQGGYLRVKRIGTRENPCISGAPSAIANRLIVRRGSCGPKPAKSLSEHWTGAYREHNIRAGPTFQVR